MKNRFPAAAALAVLASVVATPAGARDDRHMYPIEAALSTPAAQEKLDPGIALYFGNQPHPAVVQNLGEWRTNKKTNAFAKSDRDACEWVFLSAVLELQKRARIEGGNAIIGIRSNYRDVETVSDTEYMCGAGALIAGVAFKGTVVRLGGR